MTPVKYINSSITLICPKATQFQFPLSHSRRCIHWASASGVSVSPSVIFFSCIRATTERIGPIHILLFPSAPRIFTVALLHFIPDLLKATQLRQSPKMPSGGFVMLPTCELLLLHACTRTLVHTHTPTHTHTHAQTHTPTHTQCTQIPTFSVHLPVVPVLLFILLLLVDLIGHLPTTT